MYFTTHCVVIFVAAIGVSCDVAPNTDAFDAIIGDEPDVLYSKDVPLIFVASPPRSGSEMLCKMLGRHKAVQSGYQIEGLKELFGMLVEKITDNGEDLRLEEAGVTREVFNDATGAFLLSLVLYNGDVADRYALKIPSNIQRPDMFLDIFPKASMVLVVRDGRAACNSIVSQRLGYTWINSQNYEMCLRQWNAKTTQLANICKHYADRCYLVYHEQLVMKGAEVMDSLLPLLELPHDEDLSESIHQSKETQNNTNLRKWLKSFPPTLSDRSLLVAPILQELGYANDEEVLADYLELPLEGYFDEAMYWFTANDTTDTSLDVGESSDFVVANDTSMSDGVEYKACGETGNDSAGNEQANMEASIETDDDAEVVTDYVNEEL